MADLILPGNSDLSLALREPNLLVPGRDSVGGLIPRYDRLPKGTTHFLYRSTGRDANGRVSFINWISPSVALTNDSTLDTLRVVRNNLVNIGGTGIHSINIGSRTIGATGVFWSVFCVGVYVPRLTSRIGLGGSISGIIYLDNVAGGLELYVDASNITASGFVIRETGLHHIVVRLTYANGVTHAEAWYKGVKIWNYTSVGNRAFTNTFKACGYDAFKSGFLANQQSGFSYFLYSPNYTEDALLAEISRDPYNTLFQTADFSPYLIPSDVALALPTLSAPTAINITSSGFQPRVTATY